VGWKVETELQKRLRGNIAQDKTRLAALKARSTTKRLMLMPSLAAACSIHIFSSSAMEISIPRFFPVLGRRARDAPADAVVRFGLFIFFPCVVKLGFSAGFYDGWVGSQ